MALAPWPFYLLGSVVVLVGFALLHRWVQGLTGRSLSPPRSVLPAAFVAFLLGSGTIVVGIALDSEEIRIRIENTRIFMYDVEVAFPGPGWILLALPAPADERLLPFLEATNGTSTLTVNASAPTAIVEVNATESVSFHIRVEFVGRALNTTLSGVTPGPGAGNATLSILLQDAEPGQRTADVRLDIRFIEFCLTTSVHLAATLQEGSAPYPGTRDATPTC